jgi:hypothetical protein
VGVGGGDTGNSDTNGGNGIFKISGGTVNISNTLLIYPTANSAVNLSGGVLNVGEIETIGNSSRFNWTGGTLNLTNSGLTVGSGGLLGSSLTLSRSQNLEVSEYQEPLEINGALSLVNGATAEVNADSNGNIV